MTDADAPRPTRRSLRSTEKMAMADDTSIDQLLDLSKHGAEEDESRPQDVKRLRRRRRTWIWVSVTLLVLIGLGVGAGWAGLRVYSQAQEARTHLQAAMPHVAELKAAMLASDPETAAEAATAFRNEALAAQKASSGKVWDFVEAIPLPPVENVRAVGAVSDVAVTLADEVLVPASGLNIADLAPSGGRMDIAALQSLSGLLDQMVAGTESAEKRMAEIDQDALIDMVRSGVTQVDDALTEVTSMAEPARDVLEVLPDALGASGPRNYLVMFQGNAEARASGGGPGSFVVLRVENGSLSIAREAAATEFDFDIPEPVVPIDAETEALYSDIIARWVANLTATPDFPTSAALAKGWWATEFDDQIDGVISIDPVALSYMITATGPITLPTGDVLTSENTAPLLFNEAYFRYPRGVDSSRFFSAVSLAVVNALLGGDVKPVPMMTALARATDEGRLKIWSADEEEAVLLGESPLSGRLPTVNDDETAVGVFFNDTTGSKMDYYVDATLGLTTDQCTATAAPTWTTSVTLENTISPEAAQNLPLYVSGRYYTPGDIGTDFVVYAPVGATIDSWTVNGKTYDAKAHTTHLGRDAVRVNITLPPLSSATLEVTMTGADGTIAADYGAPGVHHTPMVRDTPVTIDAPGCK